MMQDPHHETTDLVSLIGDHDLLRLLDDAARAALIHELTLVTLPMGEVLFRQGDIGDSMYILLRGALSIHMRHADGSESVVDELAPPASVGEMALLTGQPRVATVIAQEDSQLLRLSEAAFTRLAALHQQALHDFAYTMLPRLRRTQLAGILKHLFGELSPQALRDIQAALSWQRLAAGEVLYRQGEGADSLAIVVTGRLHVSVTQSDGSTRRIGEIGRGECVGEFALLSVDPRSATVTALRASDVALLSHPHFERLLAQHPQAMVQIARLAIRHAQMPYQLPTSTRAVTFALIPAHANAPVSALAERLASKLARYGATLHLSSRHLDQLLDRPGIAQTSADHPTDVALLGWLSEQEEHFQAIIYEADETGSPWTQRCLHQADRVLVVGCAGDDPTPGPIEASARRERPGARYELALVQAEDCRQPQGTQAWLAARAVQTHHHVRLGNGDDLARMARRLTGRALGLVLSGGGARGYVHVGAYRALDEANVTVDMIGGASMGALLGATLAAGMSRAEILRMAEKFSSRRRLIDYTLPLTSFAAGRAITTMLQHMFGDTRIEDLWRPYFAVASNLSKAEPVLFQEGLLWEAVRASIAIPGVFAPLLRNGDTLVDGGLLNNFPLDLMREVFEAGTMVDVSANPAHERPRNYHFGDSVSGWQLLWSRINPFSDKKLRAPSLFGTLFRSVETNSLYRMRSPEFRHMADVLIEPPVEEFARLSFDQYEEIVAAGYVAAREQIPAWLSERTAEPLVVDRTAPCCTEGRHLAPVC